MYQPQTRGQGRAILDSTGLWREAHCPKTMHVLPKIDINPVGQLFLQDHPPTGAGVSRRLGVSPRG